MDILRTFVLHDKSYPINILWEDNKPLFRISEISNILQYGNIYSSIINFKDKHKVVRKINTPGGKQDISFFTKCGIYKLLMQCRKPIAEPFQEWIEDVIESISDKGKYELPTELENERILNLKNIEIERHNTLSKSFANKTVIYLGKIKENDDNTFIIKIGESYNIEKRCISHKTSFGNFILKDVFECIEAKRFEDFLKKHHDTCYYYHPIEMKDKTISTETYLVNNEQYNAFLTIIKKNIDKYQGINPIILVEYEKIKLQRDIIQYATAKLENNNYENKEIDELIKKFIINDNIITKEITEKDNNIHDNNSENDDISEIDDNSEIESINESVNKVKIGRKNTRNRKIQQYNKDTFELIETFDGMMEVLRTFPTFSAYGIKKAATKNNEYNGYRWFYIDRNAENIKYNIPPTVHINTSIPKHIAVLNKEQTQIIAVYESQASLAKNFLKVKRKQTVNDDIKNNTLVKKMYYFKYYEDCPENLKQEYLSRETLPPLNPRTGKKIMQIDPETKEVIKIFDSVEDVKREFCVSRPTLLKHCENGKLYVDYYWKEVV